MLFVTFELYNPNSNPDPDPDPDPNPGRRSADTAAHVAAHDDYYDAQSSPYLSGSGRIASHSRGANLRDENEVRLI